MMGFWLLFFSNTHDMVNLLLIKFLSGYPTEINTTLVNKIPTELEFPEITICNSKFILIK
jgi:hypothetical protein